MKNTEGSTTQNASTGSMVGLYLAASREAVSMTAEAAGGASRRGSHRLSEAALCPRKWYLHFGMGVQPKKTALHFVEGTLFHLCRAYSRAKQMEAKQPGSAPAWFHRESLDQALEREGKGYPDAIKLAKAMDAAYERHYAGNDPWEPVAVEKEYTATLGQLRKLINPTAKPQADDGEVVSSRIDLIYRANGYLWACDYKTTAHGYQAALKKWNPDGEYSINWQFLLQTGILRVNLGSEFKGVVVERCLKKEPFDFDRSVAPINPVAFRDLPNVIARQCFIERDIARQAVEAGARGEDMSTWLPSGNWWNCFSWGSPCEFRALCTSETAGQFNDTLVREYQTQQ